MENKFKPCDRSPEINMMFDEEDNIPNLIELPVKEKRPKYLEPLFQLIFILDNIYYYIKFKYDYKC